MKHVGIQWTINILYILCYYKYNQNITYYAFISNEKS